MKYSLGLLALLLSIWVNAQKMTVEFIKDGNAKNIDDDFKVYFLVGDSSYMTITKPKIDGNSFFMPPVQNNEAIILFEYKGKVYNLGTRNIDFKQNMKWVFGFDKKPYSREYYTEATKNSNVEGVFYLELHPQEKGDGVVTAVTFENTKEFLKYGKFLIYSWE